MRLHPLFSTFMKTFWSNLRWIRSLHGSFLFGQFTSLQPVSCSGIFIFLKKTCPRMSSVINSNILKKSEVTVLIHLITLELIKLTLLIKPVFHNAMWNGINYMLVIWFSIDCLCSSLAMGVWKNQPAACVTCSYML